MSALFPNSPAVQAIERLAQRAEAQSEQAFQREMRAHRTGFRWGIAVGACLMFYALWAVAWLLHHNDKLASLLRSAGVL